ncbi:hypothetical protein OBJ97_13150, partial [Empedobacter falsenii]
KFYWKLIQIKKTASNFNIETASFYFVLCYSDVIAVVGKLFFLVFNTFKINSLNLDTLKYFGNEVSFF